MLSQHRKGPAEGWAPKHKCVPSWNRNQAASALGGNTDTLAGRSTILRGCHPSGILDNFSLSPVLGCTLAQRSIRADNRFQLFTSDIALGCRVPLSRAVCLWLHVFPLESTCPGPARDRFPPLPLHADHPNPQALCRQLRVAPKGAVEVSIL